MMTPRLVLVLASLLAAGVQSGVVPRNLVGTRYSCCKTELGTSDNGCDNHRPKLSRVTLPLNIVLKLHFESEGQTFFVF